MSISLPAEAETIRCADFAFANSIDPGGTALAPDVIVVVDVGEPWPKPVAKHDDLIELVRAAQAHHETVRLLAGVPGNVDEPRIRSFRPIDGGMSRIEQPLGDDPVGALATVLGGTGATEVMVADSEPPTLLVCTQGSHDVCCGTHGAALADWVELHRPDVEVIRVSHTGGHRFSPTAMTLPNGRMWAYLDERTVVGVLDRELDSVEAATLCRGWWGAPTGPSQIAERAAFSALGWNVDEQPRRTETTPGDGDSTNVALTLDESVWMIEVSPGREVPTIACDAPGGLPIKPGREWVLGAVTPPSTA